MNIFVTGSSGGYAGQAGLTPATPGSWPPNLGWLGSSPKGDAPRGFRSNLVPGPWFPGRLATPKMFTAVVRRPAPNPTFGPDHGGVGDPHEPIGT